MAQLLANELQTLGAEEVHQVQAGVAFTGPFELGYRTCLWSRLASRVLLPLTRFEAPTPEALYEGVQTVRWEEHLERQGTLAVNFNSTRSAITHTHYGALKVKDAIVDQFRQAHGVRPSVDLERPDLRINAHLHRDQATLSLDLAGASLHRRGYRGDGMEAPLKENLAAAILLRAGWPAVAAQNGMLLDLMCGSGTLPIEGALIAADCAPGLGRDYFGFCGWKGHQAKLWKELLEEAQQRRAEGMERLPQITGYDAEPRAVQAALANVARAGLSGKVQIERQALSRCRPLSGEHQPVGLVVVNPPYGERLGEVEELRDLYAELGKQLKQHFAGWKAVVFTANPELGRQIGLRAVLTNKMYNGPLECRLLRFEIMPRFFEQPKMLRKAAPKKGPGAEMFANRLRKNRRILGRWARKAGINCFRLYDADMPEYALAVDLYQGAELWAHVQEYKPPDSIDADAAKTRLQEALAVIPEVLEIADDQLFFKVRERKKGRLQYEKLTGGGRFYEVREEACVFLVNFTGYLDTGLFLDHRPTRKMIGELARGRRFLNLFGYTGTATVQAAAGGATATTTVDMSHTYLEWARRNLQRNGLDDKRHQLVQADCLAWLEEQQRERYGLIFLDPPTFSNSKLMDRNFDVQQDHAALIKKTAALLERDGLLIFSSNFRRFRMDRDALEGLEVKEITRETIPKDFARRPKIHSCWKIARRSE